MRSDSILAAKYQSLSRRVAALPSALDVWLQRAGAGNELEFNFPQIEALDHFMRALCRVNQDSLDVLDPAGDIDTFLTQTLKISANIVKSEIVWEFFRSRLDLRFVPELQRMLATADLVSYDCYTAIIDRARALRIVHRQSFHEVPLVGLAAQFSASTWHRGRRPPALQNRNLPVPIIDLPLNCLATPWELLVIAHEVGHVVDDDLGQLTKALQPAIASQLEAAKTRQEHIAGWQAWTSEIVADVLSTLLAGPAFCGLLIENLSLPIQYIRRVHSTDSHVPHYLRVLINAALLRRQGLTQSANTLEVGWKALYGEPGEDLASYLSDVETIISVILDTPLSTLQDQDGVQHSLSELISFTSDDQMRIEEAAVKLTKGASSSLLSPRHVVSASRLAFEQMVKTNSAARLETLAQQTQQAIIALAPAGMLAARLTSRRARQHLANLSQEYLGQLHSIETVDLAERKLIEIVQRFLNYAGFELTSRDAEGSRRIVAMPQKEVWKKRFEYGIYVAAFTEERTETDGIFRMYEDIQEWNPKIKHALLFTDRGLSLEEWSMVNHLAIKGFTIISVPSHLVSTLSPEAEVRLLIHIDKRLGPDYDPFEEHGPVYGPGSFFGRIALLNKLDTALREGRPQILLGIRKLGKSSILYHLATRMDSPTAIIDLQGSSTNLSSLYKQMLIQWAVSAKSKNGIDWSPPVLTDGETMRDDFVEAVRDLIQDLRTRMEHPRLTVFVDEVELLVPTHGESGERLEHYLEFMETLRALSSGNLSMLSILLTSFDPALVRISHWGARQNPAYQLFDINYLNPMSTDDCGNMIISLGKQVNLEFKQEAVDLVYKASGGHPFIARQVCSLAFKHMEQTDQIPMELLEKVVAEFLYNPNTASLLNRDGLWGTITQPAIWGDKESRAQAELLRFLAEEDGPRPISEFVKTSGPARKHAAVEELKDFSVIKEVAPGHYDITFGCFKNWIRAWQL